MDKESFRVDLMNRERVARHNVEYKRKKDRQKEIQRQRREAAEQRRAERILPARALADQNRSIVERATSIMGLVDPKHDHLDAAVLLGPTPETELTPNHFTVCTLRSISAGSTAHPKSSRAIKFDFYHLRSGGRRLKQVRNYNAMPTHAISESVELNAPIVIGPTESTYLAANHPRMDEIYNIGCDLSSGRRFEPVRGIQRAIELMRISRTLHSLEDTMATVEAAARDEELNPHLALKFMDTKVQAVS